MKLFLVIRWGNDESPDGPNDPDDTCFLVRAFERDEAIPLVDTVLARMSCERVPPFCQQISEVGIDLTNERTPAIIIGPFFGRMRFSGRYPNLWGRITEYVDDAQGLKWRPHEWYMYEDQD